MAASLPTNLRGLLREGAAGAMPNNRPIFFQSVTVQPCTAPASPNMKNPHTCYESFVPFEDLDVLQE